MPLTTVALSSCNVALSVEMAISNEIQHMKVTTSKDYMYGFILYKNDIIYSFSSTHHCYSPHKVKFPSNTGAHSICHVDGGKNIAFCKIY